MIGIKKYLTNNLKDDIIYIEKKEKDLIKMKKFFNITEPYTFEWNDLRCVAMVINVMLIMCFGLSISWLGLGIAVIGIIRDLTTDRRISGLIIHASSAVLNIYFLYLLYNGGI